MYLISIVLCAVWLHQSRPAKVDPAGEAFVVVRVCESLRNIAGQCKCTAAKLLDCCLTDDDFRINLSRLALWPIEKLDLTGIC